ncbi:MAG: hypothetical protein P9E24_06860 [Candidatus Competibacter sp.]|nr:hypothetical protein [Candidatus Competibacter sp.]MDG4585696.1 hypothetical protein [Candidatus Competibacter sp.]
MEFAVKNGGPEKQRYRFALLKNKKDAPHRSLRKIILSAPGRRELPGGWGGGAIMGLPASCPVMKIKCR